jgi:predicted SAM-dependent methyltransferase
LRSISSYAKVQALMSRLFRDRYVSRRAAGLELLDVGCGPNLHPQFINLDYNWRPGIDICCDVTRGIPLPSQSLRGIFTEHMLEHVPREAARKVLAEFRRLLRPGGAVRIVVPDGEIYLRRYVSGEAMPYPADTPITSVNNVFNGHGHRYIYDFMTLRAELEAAGFTDVARKAFNVGRAELLMDTPSRAVESLYVEATSA